MAERTTAKDVIKKWITPTETTAEVNQTAQDLINQEWSTQKPKTLMVDPIAYRSDYNPNDIIEEYRNDPNIPWVWPQNANLNYNAYWDDSNPAWQWQRGGMNEKYTGEGVKNTYIDYNPDIKTWDLDPNYLYWEAARQQNRKEAGYIARRNDMIASALYNEWLISKEDVARFLWSQSWWTNSTEEDRLNTIESVWKRLWQIQPNEEEVKPDPSKAEQILTDTSGQIYWKTTAEEGEPSEWINTLADANSVFRAMEEARVKNLQELISMNPSDIAEMMVSGLSPFSETTMRDAQKYYPEFVAKIEAERKKKLWQQNVNAMTSGSYDYVTSEMDAKKWNIDSSVEAMAQTYSSSTTETETTRKEIEDSVATNQTATEANGTMDAIEKEAAILKNRLKNLREEANRVFKWDAPDYMVNAYINNKTQEIQNQLSILEDRYNAAYQRYTTQLDQEWKQKQYNLQLDQLNLQKQQAAFNQRYQKQQLDKSNYTTDENGNVWHLTMDENGSVYYEKVEKVQTYAWSWMKSAWLRNNNPWNIKDNDFWNVLWHDERGFAKFATPEDWFDALVEKIMFNQTNPKSRYYGKTILEYFKLYAPSADGNNPLAYAQSVAKQLWVSVNTPISELDPVKFAAVIAKHDSGYDYSTYWQFRWNTTDWTATSGATFNIDEIEIPWSIFEDETLGMTIDPNSEEWRQKVLDYLAPYIMQNVDVSNTSYSQWPLADDGITPIAYRQRIYQLVPTMLKNSDEEKKTLYDTARRLYQAGYTADQAALTFYWLDLTSDSTWMLESLVDIARAAWVKLSDTFYWNMGSFTERGLNWAAVSLLENEVLPDDQRKQIAKYTAMLQKLQNVRTVVNDVEEKVWPISWRLSELKNKWFKSDEEYQKAVTAIDVAFSQLRNSLLWSAITESEKALYENLFPNKEDFYDNILIKLQQSEDWLLADINSIRNTYLLPSLNSVDQALYPSLRLSLYKSMQDVFN